ncbi:hypothetical protein AWENTII_008348 [Aspergillus wentii]
MALPLIAARPAPGAQGYKISPYTDGEVGTDGDRPDKDSHPGKDGGRPGKDGSRPGKDGGRPGGDDDSDGNDGLDGDGDGDRSCPTETITINTGQPE